jgi:hypothetical protein
MSIAYKRAMNSIPEYIKPIVTDYEKSIITAHPSLEQIGSYSLYMNELVRFILSSTPLNTDFDSHIDAWRAGRHMEPDPYLSLGYDIRDLCCRLYTISSSVLIVTYILLRRLGERKFRHLDEYNELFVRGDRRDFCLMLLFLAHKTLNDYPYVDSSLPIKHYKTMEFKTLTWLEFDLLVEIEEYEVIEHFLFD